MNAIAWLTTWLRQSPSPGDLAYGRAVSVTDDLIHHMRDASQSSDVARAIMADIWRQNRNIPLLTTVYESVQEAKSSIEQRPEDLPR